jgi:tRNA (guanosine-2'-O-)-methyltransferase
MLSFRLAEDEKRSSKAEHRPFSSVAGENRRIRRPLQLRFALGAAGPGGFPAKTVPPTPDDPELLAFLESFLTAPRRRRLAEVLAARTDYVRVVIEDIFQPHNASAVLRSCEGFGIQHVHIIENRFRFAPNRDVALGTPKWLTLHRHRAKASDNTRECLEELRAKGFRLVATAPRADALPLEELPLDRPLAVIFGTEKEGLSATALAEADLAMQVPMFGFVESFNISVCAALCLSSILRRVRSERDDWRLPAAEAHALRALWIRRSLKTPEALERRFEEERETRAPGSARPTARRDAGP